MPGSNRCLVREGRNAFYTYCPVFLVFLVEDELNQSAQNIPISVLTLKEAEMEMEYTETGSLNQKFAIEQAEAGYYYIRCMHSGKYLQPSSDAQGAKMIQNEFTGSTLQQFIIVA